MSEELRDELATMATAKRPKFLGFGSTEAAFAGNVANGVKRRQAIRYNGPGLFNVAGIAVCSINLANWARGVPGRNNFSASLMLSDQTIIVPDSFSWNQGIVSLYDTLDSMIVLGTNDYLVYEVNNFSTTAQQFVGVLYGDEYLF